MLDYITQRGSAATRRWAFAGANRQNTDNGRAWVRVTASGADFIVTIYSDELWMRAVAWGARTGAGPVTLAALNDSGLSGSVELAAPQVGSNELDIFYACDEDLAARHTGAMAHVVNGLFAGEPGLRGPCAAAKLAIDRALAQRMGTGFRAESLAPWAPVATDYALSFLYEWLSTRPDDPARELSRRFYNSARAALSALRLVRGCEIVTPFAARVQRG